MTSIALSYPLTGSCYPTLEEGPGNVPGDGPGAGAWGYQSCTETLHLFSSHGKEDGGIRQYNFDWEEVSKICDEYWGEYEVQPNPHIFTQRYGGYKIGDGLVDVSNIIFSVGALDPWGGGCFHAESAPEDAEERGLYFFNINEGAHHLDLRGPHEDDPKQLTDIRSKEEDIIKNWIAAYKK